MLFNVKSAYSLLQSTLRVDQYVSRGKAAGYTALGLADHASLQGTLEFYNACQKVGIKALIGVSVEISGVLRQEQAFRFLLYAKNQAGYHELLQVVRLLSQEPRSDRAIWQYLATCQQLVYITTGHYSELEQLILHQQEAEAVNCLQQLRAIFGEENVYLGMNGYPVNPLEVQWIQSFAQQHHVPMVMGQYVATLNKDDQFSLKVLQAIDANEQVDLSLRQIQAVHYVYDYEALCECYRIAGLEACIQATHALVAQLNVELEQHQHFLPKFDTPTELTADQYVRQLTYERLAALQLTQQAQYTTRLDYELEVIANMGFSDYFLIVWDIMKYCRQQAIRVGPGRGSAAGSLVSYLLQITGVDPIQYDLLFERFLNPERYNMPDIDMDIPDNKRQQVLHYVVERYGQEQVAQIATLGTFGARQAVRDTLRVLGASAEQLKQWAIAIPKELDMTLAIAYERSVALRQLLAQSPENQQIYQVACTLEGLPRHISTHAAAVVIHDRPLVEVIPVMERLHQPLMTQFTMYDVERVGLLKMDFLGLRNLSLLDTVVRQVQRVVPEFQIETIPMDDQATLALFRQADTNGVFQFESDGIKQVLRKLQPDRFEDIVAVNALFRPGPMKQIDHYVARRHGRENFTYLHPLLETILQPTYGIMVYQEQVMQVCQAMAGFSLGQADLLRRAMGKKQADVMQKERTHFIEGAKAKGIKEETAQAVYDYIIEFASYGFNRSHAVVYSTLAYQLAYLKAHYPLYFYQGVLNAGSSNRTSLIDYIQEAKRRTGMLLGVDVNQSELGFSIKGQQIQVGFEAIKGLRQEFCQHIVQDRQLLGPYTSVTHFMQRLPKRLLKQEWIEALIRVGAFDFTGINRPTLLKNLPKQMQSVSFSGGNLSLFAELEPKIEWVADWTAQQKGQHESDLLGFSLVPHPLAQYQHFFERQAQLATISQLLTLEKGKVSTIALVQSLRVIQTKRQEQMAFVELGDERATLSGVLFPSEFRRYQSLFRAEAILQVDGQLELDRQGRVQLVIKRVQLPQEMTQNHSVVQRCFIQVPSFEQFKTELPKLKKFAHEQAGPVAIVLVNQQRETIQLDEMYRIRYVAQTQKALQELLPNYPIVFK